MSAATSTTTASRSQAPPPLWKPASVKPRELAALPAVASLPVNQKQCDKALSALLAHVSRMQEQHEEKELLGEQEEKVFLVVGLKQAPKREVHKPVRLPLPHPVMNPKESPVTLFVKDPQREYKDLLENLKIGFISRVVGLDKLNKKHKTFEAKRQLLKEADLFLVDDRVMPEVGRAIGKMWRDAKKQPIPVAIARKDLKAELERAIASTYMQVTTGTSISIKIGTTSLHTPAELLANLQAVLPYIATRIPNAPSTFSNVQSLHLKTSTSTSLPIYNAKLEDRFTGYELTEEEQKAKDDKLAEKKRIKEEKEQRKKERSATKDGQGRLEKKRTADEEETEETEKAQEQEEQEVTEAAPAKKEEAEKRPNKKAKKEKKAKA
ncbi:ribosomal L1 domain-containing protein [Sporobolomyces koalae]|uniref:ribosomal L1 domain-containing protein n=1 Tax=Sporobolomyces koalae TaxID=500713 RepID=UPI003175278F